MVRTHVEAREPQAGHKTVIEEVSLQIVSEVPGITTCMREMTGRKAAGSKARPFLSSLIRISDRNATGPLPLIPPSVPHAPRHRDGLG